jgi:hypothetical protein
MMALMIKRLAEGCGSMVISDGMGKRCGISREAVGRRRARA